MTNVSHPANIWPRWLALLVGATLALTLAHWLWITKPVRFAGTDDVLYQQVIGTGVIDSFTAGFAQTQARFYFLTPLYPQGWMIYRLDDPWIFAGVRLAFITLQFGLLAWLAARLTGEKIVGWIVLLLALAVLHLPTTYYAALSYPIMWVGFSALLGSLHLQLTGLATGSRLAWLGSGLLYLLSSLCLELFLCYLPVFVVLAVWRQPSLKGAMRSLIPQLTAFAGYLFAYVLFTRLHPSDYSGTQFSFSATEAANTLLRQTISSVPGVELFIHREITPLNVSWIKSPGELTATLTATPLTDYLLALLQAFTIVQLARRLPSAPRRLPPFLLPVTALCILLPNLPMSLTALHQVWAYHRRLPYIYGFYVYCALIVAAVIVYWTVKLRIAGSRGQARVWAGLATAACLIVLLSAKASNRTNLALLHSWFN